MYECPKKSSKLDFLLASTSRTIPIEDESHALMHKECLKVYFEHWRNFNSLLYTRKGIGGEIELIEKCILSKKDIEEIFQECIIPDAKRHGIKGEYIIGTKVRE